MLPREWRMCTQLCAGKPESNGQGNIKLIRAPRDITNILSATLTQNIIDIPNDNIRQLEVIYKCDYFMYNHYYENVLVMLL